MPNESTSLNPSDETPVTDSSLPDASAAEEPVAEAEFAARLSDEPDLTTDTVIPGQASDAAKKVKSRILVMEGDVEVANFIVNALEGADYEIELAMDTKYSLILADTFEPDLILLDVMLPGLSGGDMKQILRAAPNFSGRFVNIPILYLGEHDHMVSQRFHSSPETPMSRYIMKPINAQELRDKVALAVAELQQQRAASHD